MDQTVKVLTRCAVLTAMALAISAAEALFPLTVLLPLPGLRLGLANLVTLFALARLSKGEALAILVCRCLLGALVGGSLSALAFSLAGGLFSLCAMLLAQKLPHVSLYGVSVVGAAAHNTGQLVAAQIVLGTGTVWLYLPPLLLCSILTGAVTGLAATLLVRRIPAGL